MAGTYRPLHAYLLQGLAGHPANRSMYITMCCKMLWPQVENDLYTNVNNCSHCAIYNAKKSWTWHLNLFLVSSLLKLVRMDILCPLSEKEYLPPALVSHDRQLLQSERSHINFKNKCIAFLVNLLQSLGPTIRDVRLLANRRWHTIREQTCLNQSATFSGWNTSHPLHFPQTNARPKGITGLK